MKVSALANILLGKQGKFRYLLIATLLLMLTFLGARDIWTQEHRWADIVSGMFYHQDFLHPYLGDNQYYDKPLLSYWLIALIAKITGSLTTWALRLPSVLSGILAIYAIYQLGSTLKNKQLGLLAGWLLLTTFYFVFWARTSSADMLNLAGSLYAVSWYMQKKAAATFFDYTIFFIVIALTSLCKGLVGLVVPVLVVLTDICLEKSWRKYLTKTLLLASFMGLVIYLLPFLASSYFNQQGYGENGLYLVYRENILRYFQPFDHKGPLYTYFLYLPIYLLPWAVFFIPACFSACKRWNSLSPATKWLAWVVLVLFLFFTCSGSRRSYYILPLVPFAILFTADWLLEKFHSLKYFLSTFYTILCSFILIFLMLDAIPAWYFAHHGAARFSALLQQKASEIKPWSQWQVVMLDAESKLTFYLQLSPLTLNYGIKGKERDNQTLGSLLKTWPLEKIKTPDTIFVTRQRYAVLLQPYFKHYVEIEMPQYDLFSAKKNANAPVAFIPVSI